jgi:sugar lactone lactonase YvrE
MQRSSIDGTSMPRRSAQPEPQELSETALLDIEHWGMRRYLLSSLLLVLSIEAHGSQLLVGNFFGNTISRYDTASSAYLGDFTGGDLVHPQGMAIGADGRIYVASEGTNEVLRYGSDGSFTNTFLSNPDLNGPTGLTFDSGGNLLIGSFNADSVFRVNSAGSNFQSLVAVGAGGLSGPDVGTVIGPDGALYVTSFNTNSVLRYNATTGASLGTLIASGAGGLTHPRGLAFHGGNVFVTSENGNSVLRYAADGSFLGVFVSSGSGGLSGASGEAFDTDGTLYLSSWQNNRILHYDANGAFLGTFASGGPLNGPTFLTIVPEPRLSGVCAFGLARLLRRRRSKP